MNTVILEFFPYPFLIGISILLILLIDRWGRKRNALYLLYFSVFWIYLLFVVALTLFPLPIVTFYNDKPWRQSIPQILSHINFIPFYYGDHSSNLPVIVRNEIVRNILLTVPFGFCITYFIPSVATRIPWVAFAVGFAIESMQLLFLVIFGIRYRTIDINDVILNALGVMIGFGLYKICEKIFTTIWQRFGLRSHH